MASKLDVALKKHKAARRAWEKGRQEFKVISRLSFPCFPKPFEALIYVVGCEPEIMCHHYLTLDELDKLHAWAHGLLDDEGKETP